MCLSSYLFFFLFILIHVELFIFEQSNIYKLPRLILHADEYYLTKNKEVALSCQIEPGWRGTKMSDVYWIKDGAILHDIINQRSQEDIFIEGPTLRILNGRHYAEGDYQCSAVIRGVRISNGEHIDTRLVSAPVKFRKARTTKFEKVHSEAITVLQGQTARVPCLGMPDVIPGPPELWFEKEEDEVSKALLDDRRYLITLTGMQIALSKVSDSGKYFCVIRNKFTNKTRKSPYAVELQIAPGRYNSGSPILLYPRIRSSVNEPIVLHVVKGKKVVLECVIASARVMWTKVKPISTGLAVYNDRARFQQLWGNLLINQLNEADEGVYLCEGYSIYVHSYDENPKVYYELHVHAPTDVQLMLNHNDRDNTWKLSCLALNLHYEIPMIYVNGLALVEAMNQLGVPPYTNFFTNPINATFRSNVASSWSIQCISRPAMDEAEVYGNGLERGRAMNLYVDNRIHRQIDLITQGPENSTKTIGESVYLVCLAAPRTKKTLWIKDGKRFPIIGNRRIRLVGKATLMIMDIQLEDEGWYTCEAADNANHITRSSAYLRVLDKKANKESTEDTKISVNASLIEEYLNITDVEEIDLVTMKEIKSEFWFNRKSLNGVQMHWFLNDSDIGYRIPSEWRIEMRYTIESEWIEFKRVEYLLNEIFVSPLNPQKSYQFRVIACFDDNTTLASLPSKWIQLDLLANYSSFISKIGRLDSLSSNSLRLILDDELNNGNEKFIVMYSIVGSNNTKLIISDNNSHEIILSGLEPSTEYEVTVVKTFGDGRNNYTSLPFRAITKPKTILSEVFFGTKNAIVLKRLATVTLLFSIIFFLIAFIISCLRRQTMRRKKTKNYTDTSWRIFQEHRALKSRLFYYRSADFGIGNNEHHQYLNLMKLNGFTSHKIRNVSQYERESANPLATPTDEESTDG